VAFDEPGIEAITLMLISVAAVLGLVSVMLGLFSTVTGRDPLPRRIRRRLRRSPASAEDFRLRGMSLTLQGVGVTLMVSLLTINVVGGITLSGWSGYAPAASPTLPRDAVFLVTAVAALVAVTCFIGAFVLGLRVRYASTRASAQPGMPPA
jgi:hypothetical protein